MSVSVLRGGGARVVLCRSAMRRAFTTAIARPQTLVLVKGAGAATTARRLFVHRNVKMADDALPRTLAIACNGPTSSATDVASLSTRRRAAVPS